jgi:hypothetical protein
MGIPARAGVSGTDRLAADFANGVITGTLTGVGPGKVFSASGPLNLSFWGERTATLTTTAGSLAATLGSATGLAAGDAINSVNVPPGTTIGVLAGTAVTLALPPQFWPGRFQTGVALITDMVPGDGTPGTIPSSLATLVGSTILDNLYFPAATTILSVGLNGTSLVTSAAPTGVPPEPFPRGIWFKPTGNAIVTTGADAVALFTGAAIDLQTLVNIERSLDGGATWVPCNVGTSGAIAQYGVAASATLNPIMISFGDPEASSLYRLNVLAYTAVAGVAFRYRISTTGQASKSLSHQQI